MTFTVVFSHRFSKNREESGRKSMDGEEEVGVKV